MAVMVTMCKLFLTLALGFWLNKVNILDDHTQKKISSLIVNVTLPVLIISSVAGVQPGEGVLKLFLTGILFYCVFPVVGFLLVHVLKVEKQLRGTYICMVIFSNNAFMGYPVVSALFGPQAVFLTTIFHLGFNLMFFTLGQTLIRKDAAASEQSAVAEVNPPQKQSADRGGIPLRKQSMDRGETSLLKQSADKRGASVLRQVMNNGLIASVLALVIYFAQIPLPEAVTETCSFIGNITMPLSMLVIGSSVAGCSLKELASEKKLYAMSAVRLILMPLLSYFAVSLFTEDAMLIKIVTITIGMPVASLVAMGAAPFDKQGKEASLAVVFTTLCSIITIPVMCALLGV